MDLDIEDCKNAFKQDLDYYKIDDIIDPCHQKGIWGDLEEGVLSADEFRQIILEDARPGTTAEDIDKAMARILVGIDPYKAELLNRLSQEYDLYMLSNNNAICLPFSSRMFDDAGAPLNKVFRKCFMSCEMKTLKPSPEFYKKVIEEIGGPAEDMVFIDDSLKNVEGAIAVGLPAVHYVPGSNLSALIADVLGDPSVLMEGVGR